MKKSILPLVAIVFLFISCTKKPQVCMPYKEAMAKGIMPNKTTKIQLDNNEEFQLDFVRDSSNGYPNYGSAEVNGATFRRIFSSYVKDTAYNTDKVRFLILYGGVNDISKAETFEKENVNSYTVTYLEQYNRVALDFVYPEKKIKEHYLISESYASVKNYISKKMAKPTTNRCVISIKNNDCDVSKAVPIPVAQDILYKRAHPKS